MLTKASAELNFSGGLDTKTDPKQVALGKFLALENTVFDTQGLLKKRNGNQELPSLPGSASYTCTFNGALVSVGNYLYALSSSSNAWVNQGSFTPVLVSTKSAVRNNANQGYADSALAGNGLLCVAYVENNGTGNVSKYVVSDSETGQVVVAPTVLTSADATYGAPKVFVLGSYFIIVYTTLVTATYHLVYVAVSINTPLSVTTSVTMTTSYTPAVHGAFDGVVFNQLLYLAWNGASASGIKMLTLSPQLSLSSTINPDSTHVATIVSVTADLTTNIVWVSYYNLGTTAGYSIALNSNLQRLGGYPVQIISTGTILNLTGSAQSGVLKLFYEISNSGGNYVSSVSVTQSSGSVSSPVIIVRSVGLASKSFIVSNHIYFLGAYSSTYQPSYFLVNGSLSLSSAPVLVAKLAYQNGGGYVTSGLCNVSVSGTTASFSYLFKDLIQSVSDANAAGTVVVGGIYSQTGINIAQMNFSAKRVQSSEIGSNLNLTGGFLWAYDGYSLTEQGFHLYPEILTNTTATTGGFLIAQIYYYQAVYEWSDQQGNIFRSAGSIPLKVDIAGSGTSTNTITLTIPTLRLTAKVGNPVKITLFRWSTAQQEFYQVTSISAPLLNLTTSDTVSFLDTQADATILGNSLIYTTGGVIEDTGAPASAATTLFDDRLWLVDAENPNLLWFSKQVIAGTPVEMSDLLTLYVAPTIGAQGSTGDITALSSLDDKLIIFKPNAIYYVNGVGPDNTGSNSQYSQPVFITSTVGCSNPNSIVFIPSGLLFQSGKGIWLLGRDLSTSYIGAPVEEFNSQTVLSAVNIPEKNQVRFTLDNGITLMYDYFYGQWGTFTGIPALSSTLYQDLHTYIDSYNRVFQENPGSYLDGSNPVLLSFTTSWIHLAGLHGYQRAYWFYLLGEYLSPIKLICQIAYDYNGNPTQSTLISPTNFNPSYGGTESDGLTTTYGTDNPYGGNPSLLEWRIFLSRQRCTSFQIKMQEVFDPQFGVQAGEGFSLSGINLVYALKKGFKPMSSAHSAGGGS